MPFNLSTPIEKLYNVGPKNLPRLKRLGIKTTKDLLWHIPSRYEDYSNIKPITLLVKDENACIQGRIIEIKNNRSWKRRINITKAVVADNSETIRVVWFNQPYIANQLKVGDMVSIAGKVSLDKEGIYFSSPTYERVPDSKIKTSNFKLTHTGRLVPKYPETEGITSRYIRFLINPLLKYLKLVDPIPIEIIKKYSMPDLNTAIKEIHFPSSIQAADKAKDRLAFDELLLFQLKALKSRRGITALGAPKIKFQPQIIKSFTDSLPFKLTTDQKIAAFEILKDLERSYPMNRLLNGDVGSGKTVVALMAAYQTAKAGYQAVFMAPTEILAQQHHSTIKSLLKNSKIKIGLLTASTKNKKDVVKTISGGSIKIVIGTHALIQKNITFSNLGLVVVDEQHRFGVEQRAELLRNKNLIPHLLSMTATPIPRTLALTLYGDLDISLIKEKPKGRQKIITKVIPPKNKNSAYSFLDSEIEKGRQVFLVCPRIEVSDPQKEIKTKARQYKMNLLWREVKAVKEEYKKISKDIFPHRRVAMLHGKMKPKEKEEIMNGFKIGKYDILVSTSVIEVGVDIPNATVMAIENAERFGLAQLHQFRGRVGRGKHRSYCFFMCGTRQNTENRRLRALVKSDDGFELAEYDLKIRGPGQFFGSQQSGMPDLAMASLTNLDLIKKARLEAKLLLKKDPTLSSQPLLNAQLSQLQKIRHFE